ncbi:hypothetical protein C2857_003812 [Epichloe festucae Fl1]|uniref:Uncharacterized protein n=1 Tax=Epichloe festucae (strain Fl1) TaxID=877507 RepID=A0A7S9KV29_EPIFF|nr:hypothetical protein C2857_003812 [Epichloe festucae Fl1]
MFGFSAYNYVHIELGRRCGICDENFIDEDQVLILLGNDNSTAYLKHTILEL